MHDNQFGYAVSVAATAIRWPSVLSMKVAARKGINGNQNDHSMRDSGAVYVYRNGAWVQQAPVKRQSREGALFGSAVALSRDGNTLAVAAYLGKLRRRRQQQPGGCFAR